MCLDGLHLLCSSVHCSVGEVQGLNDSNHKSITRIYLVTHIDKSFLFHLVQVFTECRALWMWATNGKTFPVEIDVRGNSRGNVGVKERKDWVEAATGESIENPFFSLSSNKHHSVELLLKSFSLRHCDQSSNKTVIEIDCKLWSDRRNEEAKTALKSISIWNSAFQFISQCNQEEYQKSIHDSRNFFFCFSYSCKKQFEI